MAETTIQWTVTVVEDGHILPGFTFNPWIGCSKVHAGCTHCYAEADMDKRRGRANWGPHGTRSVTSEAYWKGPLKWNRQAEKDGVRRKVFCASLADVFEDWGGQCTMPDGRPAILQRSTGQFIGCNLRGGSDAVRLDDVRRRVFAMIDATPHLDWLLLTKRPENVRRMWPLLHKDAGANIWVGGPSGRDVLSFRKNVFIGTSISDQETAEKAVLALLECRDLSHVLFLSGEPLLGPVNLSAWLERLDWVIVGGESGPNARSCRVEWIESIVDQCLLAGVPCFVKQLGAKAIVQDEETSGMPVVLDLRDKKGGDWSEWPDELRVREFPEVRP